MGSSFAGILAEGNSISPQAGTLDSTGATGIESARQAKGNTAGRVARYFAIFLPGKTIHEPRRK